MNKKQEYKSIRINVKCFNILEKQKRLKQSKTGRFISTSEIVEGILFP